LTVVIRQLRLSLKRKPKKKKVLGSVVNIRREFQAVWLVETVVEIRPHAVGGRDRRCVYEDGDSEDLSLRDLVSLQFSDLNVLEQDPAQMTEAKPVADYDQDVESKEVFAHGPSLVKFS
jgi:hypothetical protein